MQGASVKLRTDHFTLPVSISMHEIEGWRQGAAERGDGQREQAGKDDAFSSDRVGEQSDERRGQRHGERGGRDDQGDARFGCGEVTFEKHHKRLRGVQLEKAAEACDDGAGDDAEVDGAGLEVGGGGIGGQRRGPGNSDIRAGWG
jgi:hypothetical protein